MKKSLPLFLAGGAALLLLSGKKKKRTGRSISFDDELVVGGNGELEVSSPTEVVFSPDLDRYVVGSSFRIKVLDAWLDKRRREGKLATMDHDAGWFFDLIIDDPTTFLGDITGTGKVGGQVIYSALWLMATFGIGAYIGGFASMGATINAARTAGSATRAAQVLGPRALGIAEGMYAKGFGGSKIALALMDFGGMQSLSAFGIGKAIALTSAGAAASGAGLSAGVLAEMGINEAYSEDLAASAVEAAADFTASHTVTVAGEQVPIALLPSGDEFPKVQEFNKMIMNYIIKFQKRHFED